MNEEYDENNLKEEIRINKRNYIASQYRIASVTYGLIFCLIGIVLTTIEPFKACTKCEDQSNSSDIKLFIDTFFIFMYGVSIIWIFVMLALIIIAKREQKIAIKYPTGVNRRISSVTLTPFKSLKIEKKALLTKFKKFRKQSQDNNNTNKSNTNNETTPNEPSLETLNMIPTTTASTADLTKFYFTYDYENGTGELYMRVGTAIFAVCSLIDRGLSLIQMMEAYFTNDAVFKNCKATFTVSIISKILSFLFIFLQSFFIFKYANIVINYGKNSAVIGLMHIVCTNFCVFVRTVILETVDEIRHFYHHEDSKQSNHNAHGNKHISENTHSANHTNSYDSDFRNVSYLSEKKLGCISVVHLSSGVQEARDKLGPYFYPCVIEYSLMSMTVFYILWASIEQRYNVNSNLGGWIIRNESIQNNLNEARSKAHIYEKNPAIKTAIHNSASQHFKTLRHSVSYEKRYANQFVIDCGKSTTGLFLGIFVLLSTLISLIAYFIYKTTNKERAIELSEITELTLIIISFITVILTIIKLKMVKFDHKVSYEMGYNEALILVGLAGIYLFGFYSIIAVTNNGLKDSTEILALVVQVAILIESSVQSVFIINALKMYTKSHNIRKSKPGRSFVTFMILINVSLWVSDTFSIKKYDMNTIQLDYYNVVFWSIVSSISSPLAVFYRFHASVVWSDIWKTLYE